MRFACVAGLLALALSCSGNTAMAGPSAPPAGQQACLSPGAWVSGVQHRSSGVSVIVLSDLAGTDAQAVVQRINDTPPKVTLRADRILILGGRSTASKTLASYVLVAFFNHDCLVTSGRVDPRTAAAMISGESI